MTHRRSALAPRPRSGAGSIGDLSSLLDEIPPATLAARLSMGSSVSSGPASSARDEMASMDGWILVDPPVAPSTPLPVGPIAPLAVGSAALPPGEIAVRCGDGFRSDLVVRTEAGEVRKRARREAPWTPVPHEGRSARGSSRLAVEIAGSDSRTARAMENFSDLVFAPGTLSSKGSMFGLWSEICKIREIDPIPLQVETLQVVCWILREAGFRSVSSYAMEAKSRHIRAGFLWDSRLQTALMDIKRAATRALHESKRAEEIKLVWWSSYIDRFGFDGPHMVESPEAPAGALFVVGTCWLLREVELAAIWLDAQTIRFERQMNSEKKLYCTLKLSASKTDPRGRGVMRTLECRCGVIPNPVCPVHALKHLVDLQVHRLGYTSLEDVPAATYTLVSQVQYARRAVEKQPLIREAQRHAALIRDLVPDAVGINPINVTGHFMRRSGAKHLARLGVDFAAIQWMARHSSQVTWT